MRGKLLVIEGIDSSGKTTQLGLLKEYLISQKTSFKTIDFPQYETSFYGKMIARFLRGEFGPLEHVNPYIISVIYALDRGQAKEAIEKWLKDGDIVISNRYATSNMAHQAGRLAKNLRNKFLEWDEELEYNVNKIPREDIVIFLDVPSEVAQKLMRNDNRVQAYRHGKKKDMVEKDVTYLKHAEETYTWLAKKFPHWVRIHCLDKNGQMRSKEDIHTDIKKILANKGIIR
jgi:dTMP kinase